MTEKKVKVIDKIQTEVSADYVHIKIVEQLKDRMLTREDLIEREQCVDLSPVKSRTMKRVTLTNTVSSVSAHPSRHTARRRPSNSLYCTVNASTFSQVKKSARNSN